MHPLVSLAKMAVERYVTTRMTLAPRELTAEMRERAAAFVSIKIEEQLRGCIGTIVPVRRNLAEEVVYNAIGSATQDPRFAPVTISELVYLTYSVDVLTAPERVLDAADLDPAKYGLIVEANLRRGVLLPELEGVDTVEQQILICREKAGILPKEPVALYRFLVKRYN